MVGGTWYPLTLHDKSFLYYRQTHDNPAQQVLLSHVTEEETEFRRGCVSYPGPHGWEGSELQLAWLLCCVFLHLHLNFVLSTLPLGPAQNSILPGRVLCGLLPTVLSFVMAVVSAVGLDINAHGLSSVYRTSPTLESGLLGEMTIPI